MGSISRGLQFSMKKSIILSTILKHSFDNPANFDTAFGNSNDNASITAYKYQRKKNHTQK